MKKEYLFSNKETGGDRNYYIPYSAITMTIYALCR